MYLDAMDREQYMIFMQAVIKFERKYGIEFRGACLEAFGREAAVVDRLSRTPVVSELTDAEAERVCARYAEVMSELTPRVDRIFELCIGDSRFKRDFLILLLVSPKRVENILSVDEARFDAVCEQCRGLGKTACAAALGELISADDPSDLAKVVDNTYDSYY